MKLIGGDRLRWLDEAAALGPIAALRMGPLKAWVITDPDAAKRILVTENASWGRPPTVVVPIRVAVGENLFTQRDRAWAQLQPAVAPAFRKSALQRRLDNLDALDQKQSEFEPLLVKSPGHGGPGSCDARRRAPTGRK